MDISEYLKQGSFSMPLTCDLQQSYLDCCDLPINQELANSFNDIKNGFRTLKLNLHEVACFDNDFVGIRPRFGMPQRSTFLMEKIN